MTQKSESFRKVPVIEFLLARQERGVGRYRKQRPRDAEEQMLLKDLALKKMEKADQKNFLILGDRHRCVLSS